MWSMKNVKNEILIKYQLITFGYEQRNRKVFRCCLKTESDSVDLMCNDSLFNW